MTEKNPYNPRTEPEQWQAWLNDQVAQHDAEQQSSGNENQNFEINPE